MVRMVSQVRRASLPSCYTWLSYVLIATKLHVQRLGAMGPAKEHVPASPVVLSRAPVKCKQCLVTGSAPIFVFVDREVPKKMTDVPMITTRFTCNAHSAPQHAFMQ